MAGGLSTVKVNFDERRVNAAVKRALKRGVKLAAEHVLGESQQEVPLEESTLQRSGHTEVDEGMTHVEGTISYDTPYAVVQHERLDFKHDAGRKAKYLEDPLFREARAIQAILAGELRKEL